MKQILPVCCFCDKVGDNTGTGPGQEHWQEFRNYMVMRRLRPEDVVFAYTCCRDCLKDDPGATAFRTRWSQSSSSVLDNGSPLR